MRGQSSINANGLLFGARNKTVVHFPEKQVQSLLDQRDYQKAFVLAEKILLLDSTEADFAKLSDMVFETTKDLEQTVPGVWLEADLKSWFAKALRDNYTVLLDEDEAGKRKGLVEIISKAAQEMTINKPEKVPVDVVRALAGYEFLEAIGSAVRWKHFEDQYEKDHLHLILNMNKTDQQKQAMTESVTDMMISINDYSSIHPEHRENPVHIQLDRVRDVIDPDFNLSKTVRIEQANGQLHIGQDFMTKCGLGNTKTAQVGAWNKYSEKRCDKCLIHAQSETYQEAELRGAFSLEDFEAYKTRFQVVVEKRLGFLERHRERHPQSSNKVFGVLKNSLRQEQQDITADILATRLLETHGARRVWFKLTGQDVDVPLPQEELVDIIKSYRENSMDPKSYSPIATMRSRAKMSLDQALYLAAHAK